jgi:hypothetical protein
VLAVVALAWRFAPVLRSNRLPRRLALTAAAGVVAVGVVAVGVVVESHRYQRSWSVASDDSSDAVVHAVLARSPTSAPIALTGQWISTIPIAPLFGLRIENHVDYLGPWVHHRLERYTTARAFDLALRKGHYPLLVVAFTYPYYNPHPREEIWATRLGYRPVAISPLLILMQASSV